MPNLSRLILFAHGSRDARWQATFQDFLAQARQALGEDSVELAYMEMCPPSLLDVSETAYRQGVRHLKLLPLFMSAGGHVSQDLPRLADQAMTAFEGLTIEVLPPVGEHPKIQAAFLNLMRDYLSTEPVISLMGA